MNGKEEIPTCHPDQKVRAFIWLLESGGHSRSILEKFNDFLELAFSAVAKPCALDEARADELESRDMKIVGRYHESELDMIREVYPEMMGIMANAVMFGGMDFLGIVAGELNALNAEQGQFFTPYEVSRMMALMTLDSVGGQIESEGYITLREPAAGAGGMVLAYADVIESKGFDITTTMLVHAVDVSYTAFQMCYLQLAFRGVPALVVRGNGLSMEVFESAWTPAAVHRFLPHHGHLSFDKPKPRRLQLTDVIERLIALDTSNSHVTAIVPVGELRTVSEMTFQYGTKLLPAILPYSPMPDAIATAESIVEAAFEKQEEDAPVAAQSLEQVNDRYKQLALF